MGTRGNGERDKTRDRKKIDLQLLGACRHLFCHSI